ncbi:hypothetical protein NPIL_473571 [Nephila pilipes]|uniref:Proliferation-associated SNF2-like protein n=1 Tax=Nephila pilipes TaxID=299642 RepID=A0A8X6N1X3_NEPPI|nr:hypothetical protein NPIL_473571 [Nephila pilipes]
MEVDNNSDSPRIKNETNDEGSEALVITGEMLQEEKRLEEKVAVEERKLREKIAEEERRVEEEKCFKRLHLLLSRSSIYAKFMADKLQIHEKKMEKKQKLKERDRNANKDAATSNNYNSVTSSTKRKASQSSPMKKRKVDVNIMDVYKKQSMKDIEAEEENSQKGSITFSVDSQPKLFCGGTMRDYQIEGFEWLKTLFENGVNGILADEMGLGKTIQCIALIAYLIEMGISGPFYICGPLSTLPNWCAEFKRFTPHIPILMYHGNKDVRTDLRKKIFNKTKVNGIYCYPVVISSYNITLFDAKYLANIEWKMLVIDEAHRIKNFECKLIESLKRFNAVHRLLLTGTPLQNNLSELWSLLNFILPEIFDDLQVFQSWFDINRLTHNGVTQGIMEQEQEKQIVSIMHQILTPFLLRRTKLDVELNIPPKKVVLVNAPLTELQKTYYEAVLNGTIEDLLYGKRKEITLPRKTKHHKIGSLKSIENRSSLPEEEWRGMSEINLKLRNPVMCLRRICCHPYLISYPLDPSTEQYAVDENLVSSSGKFLVLDVLLPELKKRGHKILLFSQFTSMLAILEDYCNFRGHKFCCLNGSMKLSEREEEMRAFREDKETFIFLISTRAGGLGLNLTAADTVILYDSDWNPQSDLQAQDRCHRIGQEKPVIVYRLIIPNTVDERIIDIATAKRKLEKVIILKGRFKSTDGLSSQQSSISKEELLELLETPDENGQVNVENYKISSDVLANLLDRSNIVTTT